MTATFSIEIPQRRAVLAVAIVFSILPITSVGLRIAARRLANRSLDTSDYLIIAAAVVVVAYWSSSLTALFAGGLGFHAEEVVERHGLGPIVVVFQTIFANQLLWALSGGFVKLSILTLYLQIFDVPIMVSLARATAVFVILFELATILVTFLICTPVEFNWDQTLPGGHCGNQILSFRITGILNIVSDIVVLVLPLKYLLGLQVALYRKVVLVTAFLLGVFTCIVSLVRLITLSSVNFADVTFSLPEPIIWSGLEPSVAVTLACIPLLRPLLGRSKYSETGTMKMGTITSRSSKGQGSFRPLGEVDSSQSELTPASNEACSLA